ncbi:MAG: hypothetical protein U9R39_07850 [Campylobacterota bacterium]|nr:hypothetical protein [Campylobacterota bacterium]
MTRKQQEFYRIVANQIVDYNEDFHKEFTIKRIEQISDDKLKYLLEDINTDKDKIGKKKGYVTYVKFVHYADKIIDGTINNEMLPYKSKVEELYKKRDILINTISTQAPTIAKKNELIQNLENKLIMFKDNGKNMLDKIDYYIISKFGFYNFFDENKNYKIKEEIDKHLKEYTSQKMLENNSVKRLN